jgi:hypothetical protein
MQLETPRSLSSDRGFFFADLAGRMPRKGWRSIGTETAAQPDVTPTGQQSPGCDWLWRVALLALVVAFVYAFYRYPAATYFQTDDYLWRLWGRLEDRPWVAFCDDLAGGQAFRPLRYLSWYALEQAIPRVPGVVPAVMLAAFAGYGTACGTLAWQVTRDRWLGLIVGSLALFCPLLARYVITWYSALEDLVPPELMIWSCCCVIVAKRTGRRRWWAAALVLAAVAGMWKELAFVMPALAWIALLAAGPAVSPLPTGTKRQRWADIFGVGSFVVLLALLAAWRHAVIGGGGLIGHHGLLFADLNAKLDQLVNLAALLGAAPIGCFYVPAVERSFPVSMAVGPNGWTLSTQLVWLLSLVVGWLVFVWVGSERRAAVLAGLWYVASWAPAATLTIVQPSYLVLPAFGCFLFVGLLLRRVARAPWLATVVLVGIAAGLSFGTARYFGAAEPGADAVRRETDSLLEMVRSQSGVLAPGTRVVLLDSRVLRPDLIAELDAAYRGERCPLDLYNFAVSPVELIAPAVPLEFAENDGLVSSGEGLREGHIAMAGREYYFVALRGDVRRLADSRLGVRFWSPTPAGWRDVTP